MPYSRAALVPLVDGLLLTALLVLLVGPGAAAPQAASPVTPGGQGKTMTIDEIYARCGVPGDCSTPGPCEQTRCRIQGVVSRINIWDQRLHPWLPESKFLLYNAAQTLNLEVRVVPAAAPRILDTLAAQSADWDGTVTLSGTLVGIDLPIMTGCRRALIVLLSPTDSLVIGQGGATAVATD